MTLDDAIIFLTKEYEKAIKKNKRTPIVYALYHTWRYFDSRGEKNETV